MDSSIPLSSGTIIWESAQLIKFPTLMRSVGGWVFLLDVTRGERRKFYISSAHSYTNSHILHQGIFGREDGVKVERGSLGDTGV